MGGPKARSHRYLPIASGRLMRGCRLFDRSLENIPRIFLNMDFRVPQIKDSDPGMGIIVIKTASKPNDLAYAEDLFHALKNQY